MGGLTAEMQSRLGRLQAVYEADLAVASALLLPVLEAALEVGVVVLPSLKAELHLAGEADNFIVSHAETPVLRIWDGVVQSNYLPASVMALLLERSVVAGLF